MVVKPVCNDPSVPSVSYQRVPTGAIPPDGGGEMRGVGPLALAALVVVSALTAVAAPAAAADDAFVAVDTEVSPDPAQPGTNVTVTTTVENVYDNGSPYKFQRVSLHEGEASNSTEHDSRTPSAIVGKGESVSVNVSEEFDRTGEYDRYVRVKLISSRGRVIDIVRPVTVTVEQPHPAMSLTADDATASGRSDLSLTLANGLPDTVRGLSVEFESDDVSLMADRRVVSSLDPGQQANVTVPVRNASAGKHTVTTRLSYLTADGESRTVTERLSATIDEERPAQIDLTGLRTTQEGDEVVVRGSASNTGGTNASSVTLSVGDGDAVSPAQNQATYFVGEVKASDYSSFEVHATLTTNTNRSVTVPVEVSYSVDGERVTRTVDVGFTPDAPGPGTQSRQSSSSPVVPAVVGLVALVVGGLAWHRFR